MNSNSFTGLFKFTGLTTLIMITLFITALNILSNRQTTKGIGIRVMLVALLGVFYY